jgi:UDP-GlcNAc:undecaprenyl-phosphate GlcNAc-1-phosphate transferase
LAVILPFLPEVHKDMPALGLFSAELIILFFSFELLLHAFSEPVLATSSPGRGVKQLGLVSLWVLFGLGVRIWL